MNLVNLYVPLLMPDDVGFHDTGVPEQILLGYPIRLVTINNFYAIEFRNVPRVEADTLLQRFRALLPWAAMRLDWSIQTSQVPLQQKDTVSPDATSVAFAGTVPTIYPHLLSPNPVFVRGDVHAREPITKLVEALREAEAKTTLSVSSQTRLQEAFALFTTADFETSDNAKFVILTTVLEMLAAPQLRPQSCKNLIDRWLHEITNAVTADGTQAPALQSLKNSLGNLKRESFRGSIRRLVTESATQLGKPNPQDEGALAADLYDDRGKLVHDGITVQKDRLAKLRGIVRYVLEACGRQSNPR